MGRVNARDEGRALHVFAVHCLGGPGNKSTHPEPPPLRSCRAATNGSAAFPPNFLAPTSPHAWLGLTLYIANLPAGALPDGSG
jgi:hypothetical protein